MASSKSRVGAAVCGAAVAASLVVAVGFVEAPESRTNAGTSQAGQSVGFTSHGVSAGRAGVSVTYPRQAYTGTNLVVSGVVKTVRSRIRAVSLQERSASGAWGSIKSTRSTRGGSYRFSVAAGTVVKGRTLRIYAPRATGVTRYYSSSFAVKVVEKEVVVPTTPIPTPSQPAPSMPVPSEPAPTTPSPTEPTTSPSPTTPVPTGPAADWDPAEMPPVTETLAGSATDWTFLFDDGVRWDPCTVIDWAYDPTGSYAGSLQDMKRAFARIAGRTGLHFRYTGSVDYRTFETDQNRPAGVEVVVGWSTAARDSHLAGSTVGMGSGRAQGVYGQDVLWKMTTGEVVLDSEGVLKPGFTTSGPATWGQVMEHEALHVLGLGHASGSQQIMYGSTHSGNHIAGAGDVAGMKRIGATQGCLS